MGARALTHNTGGDIEESVAEILSSCCDTEGGRQDVRCPDGKLRRIWA